MKFVDDKVLVESAEEAQNNFSPSRQKRLMRHDDRVHFGTHQHVIEKYSENIDEWVSSAETFDEITKYYHDDTLNDIVLSEYEDWLVIQVEVLENKVKDELPNLLSNDQSTYSPNKAGTMKSDTKNACSF